ncbi:membrane protein [Gillisia sp. Hel_I_29]|uniref:membrane protein n=1 Tax=Gillisia sp. Hel_I_29 TaxID=1249975 RepID=UPI000558FD4E|nr:membrane protein [Gillisia sp. Hel_I_29]
MIKRFIIIVALLSTVLMAAQEGTSSPYSYYGIGLNKFKGTVENQSMGGLRLFSDSIHVNLRNPAAYGRLKLTTYTVAGSTQSIKLTGDEGSENSKTTTLDYLAIGIPTGKLNFGLGLIPYTSVGYRILDVNEETANRFTGRGGMNKVFLTAGYALTEDLSIGVEADYNFGNSQNTFTAFQAGVQYGTREISRNDFKGFSYNFGLDYQHDLSEELRMYSAITFAPKMSINLDKMVNTATVRIGLDGTEQVTDEVDVNSEDNELTLPGQLTIGAGLGKVNKWFMGAEYTNLKASDFGLNSSITGQNSNYKDASQYRLGGFYIPKYNSITSYLSRVVYRAGVRYEETGLSINNEDINEFGISFGLGLPAGTDFSNVNLGLEYGQRGTTSSGLIKENFFKVSISLSLNDKWFQQRKFD